jgi:hypothetical protein
MAQGDFATGMNLGMRAAEMAQRRGESEEDRKMRMEMAASQREFQTSERVAGEGFQVKQATAASTAATARDTAASTAATARQEAGFKHGVEQADKDRMLTRQQMGMKAAFFALDHGFKIAEGQRNRASMEKLHEKRLAFNKFAALLNSGTTLTAAAMRHVTEYARIGESIKNRQQSQQQFESAQVLAANPGAAHFKQAVLWVKQAEKDLTEAQSQSQLILNNRASTPEQIQEATSNYNLAQEQLKQARQNQSQGYKPGKATYGMRPDAMGTPQPFFSITGSPSEGQTWFNANRSSSTPGGTGAPGGQRLRPTWPVGQGAVPGQGQQGQGQPPPLRTFRSPSGSNVIAHGRYFVGGDQTSPLIGVFQRGRWFGHENPDTGLPFPDPYEADPDLDPSHIIDW